MPPKKAGNSKAGATAVAKPAEPEKIGILQIKIVAAYSLKNTDSGVLGDVSDPFVKVSFGNSEKQTPTIKNDLNPRWKDGNEFKFEVMTGQNSMEIEVFNEKHFSKSDCLGSTTVALGGLCRSTWTKCREKLRDSPDSEIEYEVRFDPFWQKVDFATECKYYSKLVEALATKVPEKAAPFVKQASPILGALVAAFLVALPHFVQAASLIQDYVDRMPEKIFYATLGVLMCFFGGFFPATIAAFEAWQLCGGKEALAACKKLYGEFNKIKDASKKDDDIDADQDGVPDVLQIEAKALLQRKMKLAVQTVEPATINEALSCIFTGWAGVMAVLKIKFAKTVTLGHMIGEQLYKVAIQAEPVMGSAVPEEYHTWVPICTKWFCKAVAISIAWWIQRVISAAHSAIRGGVMCTRYLLQFAKDKGYVSFNNEDSWIDEIAGWSVALLGFLFQLSVGFSVPFPLSMFLWPVSMVEYFIVWSVSAGP
mmetsp:Transcript_13523/g.26629  ORF Transcript_13523/g.26629 Transcript_13523/m.26629 type:complete len:480 (+) Transcript_13523:55-1494(+)